MEAAWEVFTHLLLSSPGDQKGGGGPATEERRKGRYRIEEWRTGQGERAVAKFDKQATNKDNRQNNHNEAAIVVRSLRRTRGRKGSPRLKEFFKFERVH